MPENDTKPANDARQHCLHPHIAAAAAAAAAETDLNDEKH
jgi:hypothetical protein